MKCLFLAIVFLFISCKKATGDYHQETEVIIAKPTNIIAEKTTLPEGAIKADFLGNRDSLYAFIKTVDASTETTFIDFENKKLPEISIPESIGAELQILKLKNFDGDILLVNAKLKDTNFNEYYLFVWDDSLWKQPVNRFDIHKSNMSDTLIPIRNNPKDTTQLVRYYSVFDMDSKSEKKFTWKLMQESVTIKE